MSGDWDEWAYHRVRRAQMQSDLATARLQGMKARAKASPPTAAVGGFPYPARDCSQWTPLEVVQTRSAANA